MAKFQVLTPVEHNLTLYVPKGTVAAHYTPVLDADGKSTGYTAPSGGNGSQVPVNSSGFIELTPLQAQPLRAAGAIGEALEEPVKESKSRKVEK